MLVNATCVNSLHIIDVQLRRKNTILTCCGPTLSHTQLVYPTYPSNDQIR